MLTVSPTYMQPKGAPEFSHINRYWDKVHGHWAAKILPGEFYVTQFDEIILTILGSCISVCIRDRKLGIGGMNHFMLPEQGEHSTEDWGISSVSSASRYGNWAMEYLINEIIKRGGSKKNFEVKVFGGGQVLANLTDIGQRNILFAFSYLHQEGFEIVSSDVGDVYPRKVVYFPQTGKVLVKRIKHAHSDAIVKQEKTYLHTIDKPAGGDIELFD